MGVSAGCATLADARKAKGTGLTRAFDNPYDEVWQTIPDILSELGLDLAGENHREGYILAQRSATAFSYGENVAIFIERIEDNKTKVEVVSKKAMSTNIFAPDWADDILNALDEKLNTE